MESNVLSIKVTDGWDLQDPMVGKMLLSSGELGCSEEVLTIAATLSVQVSYVPLKVVFLDT